MASLLRFLRGLRIFNMYCILSQENTVTQRSQRIPIAIGILCVLCGPAFEFARYVLPGDQKNGHLASDYYLYFGTRYESKKIFPESCLRPACTFYSHERCSLYACV